MADFGDCGDDYYSYKHERVWRVLCVVRVCVGSIMPDTSINAENEKDIHYHMIAT